MKPLTKKRVLQISLLVLLLVVIFLPKLSFENLKAYLSQPTPSYEIVWGQAYSPNVGWINFYCNGATGSTIPSGESGGATTMPDACDSISYQTGYDPSTGDFFGVAYSSNYGWLDMNEIHMIPPTDTSDIVQVTGSSDGSAFTPYNFGTTYFGAGTPSALNPGLRYYNAEAHFCGFAYSDEVGYISFCDPQTQERAPNNVLVAGFNWNTYAVYMGTTVSTPASCGDNVIQAPEVCDGTSHAACASGICTSSCTCQLVGSGTCGDDTVQSPNGVGFSEVCDGSDDSVCPGLCTGSCACSSIPPVPGAPTLTTSARVFAATESYDDYLLFMDDNLPIVSLRVEIYSPSNTLIQAYLIDDADFPDLTSASITIDNFDFHVAGDYDLVYSVCDSAGNCSGDVTLDAFFRVVANIPIWNSADCSTTHPSVGCLSAGFYFTPDAAIVSDGAENHGVQVVLSDEFGNPVVSVAGIKSVQSEFVFENTTHLNQIANTGDSAIFTSAEFGLAKFPGGSTTGVLTEANNGDGVFEVDVASLAPTSKGYPIIGSGIDLNFEKIIFEVEALGGYTDVGEYSQRDVSTSDTSSSFAFRPTIVATPTALVWNSTTLKYEPDPNGVNNITVNAAKRFNTSLHNQSASVSITNPKIGIALDSGDESVVKWSSSKIETAGTDTGLDEDLVLDTDGDQILESPLENLSSWIAGILAGGTSSLRFHATPQLMAATAPENLITTLQVYPCYTITGQEVCHRSEELTNDGSATLYNPGIEIIGTLRSIAGTASRQTDTPINQSIGDFVQSEFRNAMNRTLASLRTSPNDTACDSGDGATIASADQFNTLDCRFNNGSVIYYKDTDVTLELTDETLPNSPRTLVVEGGNLLIKSNLKYPSSASSFGIIVLKNEDDEGGNIFVYPNVTNLVGAVYAEGGVISVNSQGNPGEDSSSTCTGANGFCDRSYELRNQIYWKGLLATANTIGGSDKNPPQCASNIAAIDCNSQATARIYDFAYLRTFHPNSGGTRATDTASDASFVVEYDARIQNNTPPLFESVGSSNSSEI